LTLPLHSPNHLLKFLWCRLSRITCWPGSSSESKCTKKYTWSP